MLSSVLLLLTGCLQEPPKSCNPGSDWADWPGYTEGHEFLGAAWCEAEGVDFEFDSDSFTAIGITATAALADSEAALGEWNGVTNVPTLAITNDSFSAPIWYTKRTDDGSSITTPSEWRDGTNAVLAADDYNNDSVLAAAQSYDWVSDGVIIESDVVIYRYYIDGDGLVYEPEWVADGTTGAGAMDLLYTHVHEFGHAIGLDHSTYLDSVMYPGQPTGTDYPGLAPGDESAAEWLYSG